VGRAGVSERERESERDVRLMLFEVLYQKCTNYFKAENFRTIIETINLLPQKTIWPANKIISSKMIFSNLTICYPKKKFCKIFFQKSIDCVRMFVEVFVFVVFERFEHLKRFWHWLSRSRL
jgi:hypothetical protein